MKIGVFVGSFDPVHRGHTDIINYLIILTGNRNFEINKYDIINYLINKKIVDKVLVVATGNYWDKQNITILKKRLDMLDFISSKNIIVDKKHNDLSYTYQILNALKNENKNNEFYLVIGADNANTLYKWKNYEELIKYGIIVIKRNNIKVNLEVENLIILNEEFIKISSTEIRSNVEKNKKYLNKEVYNYIKKNKLYSFYDKSEIY